MKPQKSHDGAGNAPFGRPMEAEDLIIRFIWELPKLVMAWM
jgi:hypothetical protein